MTTPQRPVAADAPPLRRRDVVDYALRRRATLAGLRSGRTSAWEACDAHPHLKLAARHYGAPVPRDCPVCRAAKLAEVHFVYGDVLGASAGQAKSVGELALLSERIERVDVYAVEVCVGCGWNHLVRSFVLGNGDLPAAAEG